MLLSYIRDFLKIGPTLPYKYAFKMLFRMSAIILHKLLSLNRNIFQDLSLSMTKFQPSVAYKSVAYKIKSVYTLTERKLMQDWRDKAKAKSNEEDSNSNYIWRVRGTPKNGLELKRFLKQRPVPRVA